MSKFLTTAATIVGVAAIAVASAGALAPAATAAALATITTSVSVSALATGLGLAAGVAGLAAGFLRPKPSTSVSPTTWKADPDAGIPYAMGRTFVAGQITKRSVWDKDNKWQEIQTVYSLGPVAGFEGLYVDRKLTGVGAGGVVAIADRGKMLAFTQRGLCPEAVAFGAPAAPGFGAQWKLSGLAASSIQLSYDVKGGTTFTTEPQCGYVIQGVAVYDPRKDSSYPGGSTSTVDVRQLPEVDPASFASLR